MGTTILEDISYAVDVAMSRLNLILFFLALAVPTSLVAMFLSKPEYKVVAVLHLQDESSIDPLKYDARSGQQTRMEDKYTVLMNWMTSDHVLSAYVEEINAGKPEKTAEQKAGQVVGVRNSITTAPLGSTAIQITLRDSRQKGLAKKLETLIAIFLEGLVGPERQMVSANRFLLEKYKTRMERFEQDYRQTINALGYQSSSQLKKKVALLNNIERRMDKFIKGGLVRPGSIAKNKYDALKGKVAVLTKSIENMPGEQSYSPMTLTMLKNKDQALRDARQQYKHFLGDFRGSDRASLFDLKRLTLLGRPQDPVLGKSKKLKWMLLIFIAFGTLAAALITLLEYFEHKIRRPDEFSELGGAPVVAHFPE